MDELTQADFRRLAAFRFALRRFTRFSIDAARHANLTTQQHQALLAIKGHDGLNHFGSVITVGELAQQLIVAPHTAAELVVRLQDAGLVDKVEFREDHRRIGLKLTRRAEAALRKLTLLHLREVRVLAPRLMEILVELEQEPEKFQTAQFRGMKN